MAEHDNGLENFQHAVELVFFEQWLRFYFLSEEEGKLYLRFPASELEKIKGCNSSLGLLVESLNNREVDHQETMAVLCDNMLHGPYPLNHEDWAAVLGGTEFQVTLQLLGFWVQAEEESLDRTILPFSEWHQRFLKWQDSDSIKDYAARLRAELASAARAGDSRLH